jgi:PAS domain S-box-containing protein
MNWILLILGGVSIALIVGYRMGTRAQSTKSTVSNTVHLQHELIDQAPHVAIITTNIYGLITSVNAGAEHLLGYREDELVKHKKLQELLFIEDKRQPKPNELAQHTEFDSFIQSSLSNEQSQEPRDAIFFRKDGNKRIVSHNLSALFDQHEQKNGYLFIAIDVTRDRNSIDSLRFTERLFRSALDVSSHGLAIISSKNKLLRANRALATMLGYSTHQIQQLMIDECVFIDDLFELRRQSNRILTGAQDSFQIEVKLLHKNGHHVPVILSMAKVATGAKSAPLFVANIFDLSERVALQKAQQEEANFRASILSHVVDAIITIDERALITSVNPAAERMFIYQEHELIGKNVKVLMPEPFASAHDGYLKHYLSAETQRPLNKMTRRLLGLRSDGKTFDLQLSLSELRQQTGRAFVGVVRDITEQRRVEQLKEELVSVVSHELRSPLTSIFGSLRLVGSGALGDIPEQAAELVNVATLNAERMIRLINDLLDLDKLTAGKLDLKLRPIDLSKLLRQAIALSEPEANNRQLTIHLELPKFVIRAMVDEDRLLQVVINLLSNALKFSSKGQSITVSLDQKDNKALITVIDHGPGIPHHSINKLFQRFEMAHSSADSHRGGTGLGLAISKALIEEMKGEIGVRSEEGKGSEFFFTLPLYVREKSSTTPSTTDI